MDVLKYEAAEKQLEALTRKKKIKKFSKYGAVIVITAIVVVGAYKWFGSSVAEKPGEAVPVQPDEIIKPGEPLPGIYLSNPPVSGWHFQDLASWGVHDGEIPDQNLISNLKSGGVWISYHPDAPPEVVDGLKKIVSKYDSGVVLTPRAADDTLINLAAWGRLDKFDYWDETRVIKFIGAYKK